VRRCMFARPGARAIESEDCPPGLLETRPDGSSRKKGPLNSSRAPVPTFHPTRLLFSSRCENNTPRLLTIPSSSEPNTVFSSSPLLHRAQSSTAHPRRTAHRSSTMATRYRLPATPTRSRAYLPRAAKKPKAQADALPVPEAVAEPSQVKVYAQAVRLSPECRPSQKASSDSLICLRSSG
jgi:hypothetical protein